MGACRRPDPQRFLTDLLLGTAGPSDAASLPEHHAVGGDNAALAGIRDPARAPAGTMLRPGDSEQSVDEFDVRFWGSIRDVRRVVPRVVGADPRTVHAPADRVGLAARQDKLHPRKRRRAHHHDHPDDSHAAADGRGVPVRRLLPRDRRLAGVVLGLAAGVRRAGVHTTAGDVRVLHQDLPDDESQREEGGLVARSGESDGFVAVPRGADDGQAGVRGVVAAVAIVDHCGCGDCDDDDGVLVVVVYDERLTVQAFANTDTLVPWIVCVISSQDKEKCLQFTSPIILPEALIVATLFVLAFVGLEAFLLLCRWDMLKAWWALIRRAGRTEKS